MGHSNKTTNIGLPIIMEKGQNSLLRRKWPWLGDKRTGFIAVPWGVEKEVVQIFACGIPSPLPSRTMKNPQVS